MKNNKFVLWFLLGLTFFLFLGAFTRDWTESTPTDSTVANQIDDYNRYLRVDASDRLKEMIYGFTAGENTGYPGIKELIFKQQASAAGTTNADEITWYSVDDGSNCGLYVVQEDGYRKQILKKVGTDINFVIEAADIPADLLDSQHYAANSIDPEHLVDDFTFDTFPLSPSAAPDADYELTNKKYVDDAIGQSSQVVGTSAISNTTGSYADMADMSVTITTKGGNVLLLFTTSLYTASSSDDYAIQFEIDNTTGRCPQTRENLQATHIVSMSWLETSLAAGSHTFKVQWSDTSGTVYNNGVAWPRVFTVIELPS